MPELPEVQTVVNDLLDSGILHLPIQRTEVFWPKTIADMTPQEFNKRITGLSIDTISRRGKYILFSFSSGETLLVHLRMSGKFLLLEADIPRSKHEHVVLTFSPDCQLRFHDTRKFGRFFLTRTPQTILDSLGPEPLGPDFDFPLLKKILGNRQRMLKPLLLDQSVIAGLGNIYVDEALWQARLHPCRTASSLTHKEFRALHGGIVKVLQQGLANQGTSLGDGKTNFRSLQTRKGRNQHHLKVFGRTGQQCPRCHESIQRLLVAQRGTHVCPVCQQGNRL